MEVVVHSKNYLFQ